MWQTVATVAGGAATEGAGEGIERQEKGVEVEVEVEVDRWTGGA